MKQSIQKKRVVSSIEKESITDHLHFTDGMSWFQESLGEIPRGCIILLSGRPGSGKSTIGLAASANLAVRGMRSLVILTEQSKERAIQRLEQIISHRSKRDQKKILRNIDFEDSLSDITLLPEYLLRRLSSAGHSLDLVVLYSVNAGISGTSTKAYKKIYDAFSLLRSARVSLLGIGQACKDGRPAGPATLSHETDCNLLLSTAAAHRFLQVVKNRNGRALQDPLCLEMEEETARLIPSPHQGAMAATVKSYLPSDQPNVEIQVSLGLPPYGETGRTVCPGLPRLQITQLIDSLQRVPALGINVGSFITSIQIPGEQNYRKHLHLPLAVGVISSFCQWEVPGEMVFLGELDLNLNLRQSLPESVLSSLDAAVYSDQFAKGTTLVVPAKDALALGAGGKGVKVIGVGNIQEAIELIRPKSKVRRRSKRNPKASTNGIVSTVRPNGGGVIPSRPSKARSKRAGSERKSV